jgi:hypothetical protein
MTTSTLRLAWIASLTLLPACLIGSGRLEERSLAVSDFDGIEASDAFQIDVSQASGYEVRVTTDDNVWEHLDVSRLGRTLHLGLRPRTLDGNVTLHARVSLPSLARLALSGASRAGGTVSADVLSVQLSGASRSQLDGSARELVLDGSGSSHADMRNLAADQADVTLSGASDSTLGVEQAISYDLSGASHLTVYGHPAIRSSNLSGGSTYLEK